MLERGSGRGPGAIAAARAGATRVAATDIEAKALMFVAASAHDNGVQRSVRTAAWDWNAPTSIATQIRPNFFNWDLS